MWAIGQLEGHRGQDSPKSFTARIFTPLRSRSLVNSIYRVPNDTSDNSDSTLSILHTYLIEGLLFWDHYIIAFTLFSCHCALLFLSNHISLKMTANTESEFNKNENSKIVNNVWFKSARLMINLLTNILIFLTVFVCLLYSCSSTVTLFDLHIILCVLGVRLCFNSSYYLLTSS